MCHLDVAMKDAAARPRVEEVQAREHHAHVPVNVNVNVNVSARRECERVSVRGSASVRALRMYARVSDSLKAPNLSSNEAIEPPAQYLSVTQVGRWDVGCRM